MPPELTCPQRAPRRLPASEVVSEHSLATDTALSTGDSRGSSPLPPPMSHQRPEEEKNRQLPSSLTVTHAREEIGQRFGVGGRVAQGEESIKYGETEVPIM